MRTNLLSVYLSSVILFLTASISLAEQNISVHLQNVSVTVRAKRGTGSGVLVTRELKINASSEKKERVTFVWTAAHVVDALRSVRTVIDPKSGTDRKVVEFSDAELVKELHDGGRKVGETSLLAKVIRYSDSENGEDLALLMVRKRDFVDVSATFYLGEEIPAVGTPVFHVGSLSGQVGANSMTSGIVSQVGRVLPIGSRENVVFDQTTATAFPGSSGGGIFLAKNGQYMGMLVRGGGETFNFIVPARRLKRWAKETGLYWAMDPDAPQPTIEELKNVRAEDVGVRFNYGAENKKSYTEKYPFMIHNDKTTNITDLINTDYLNNRLHVRE